MTKKISQLTALTSPADDDVIVVNDTSTGVTKKMTRSDFFGGLVPPGVTAAYIATAAPTGWLLCDGAAVSRSTYASLFAAIGTAFGTGDGSTTFNVPDLKGKIPVGRDSGQAEFTPLATSSGEKAHVLTANELAAHNHSLSDPGHSHGASQDAHNHITVDPGQGQATLIVGSSTLHLQGAGSNPITFGNATTSVAQPGVHISGSGTGISLATVGANAAHNNLQPYLVMNYIIKT